MKARVSAVEVRGTVDERGQLHLDEALTNLGPGRVRVILVPTEADNEASEQEWLRAAAGNPAFDFLRDPEEDIYTLADGKPFRDEG